MNERIKELTKQALPNVKYWDEEFILGTTSPKTKATNLDELEKIAELVVQECLLSLEPDLYSTEVDYEFEQRFYKHCRDKIIKHFGVEQ